VIKKAYSFVLCFLFLLVATHARAAVVINEIYPKYADPVWEWVELYNTDASAVSLDRWKLDHTTGDGKSFILNASARIEPHGFLTLKGSQTGIAFSVEGDTVRLFDANGALADSKSYPGTLGYNTSMGRSTDGGDGWVICAPEPYAATPNTNNKCPPAPTATPVPTPTGTPTPTPKPTATPTPMFTPTLAPQSFGLIMATPTPPQILGATVTITPTPAPTDLLRFTVSKSWVAYALLGIAAAALSLMLTLWLRTRSVRKQKPAKEE
jgi:hypothetical protein